MIWHYMYGIGKIMSREYEMLFDKEGRAIRLIELFPEYPRYKGSKFQFFAKFIRSPLLKKASGGFFSQ